MRAGVLQASRDRLDGHGVITPCRKTIGGPFDLHNRNQSYLLVVLHGATLNVISILFLCVCCDVVVNDVYATGRINEVRLLRLSTWHRLAAGAALVLLLSEPLPRETWFPGAHPSPRATTT